MKKLLNKLNFKKFVAVFTAITFIFTGVFGNSAFASVGSSMPAINTIHFDTPIIPTSLGKITSAKYFDSDDIIINIQDLHCHAETQRKIASIIGYIDNTYNLNNVYLEGAFKNVDTSWLSSFNNNKNGTKVLEGLIDSGKLSGTEYYSIINNKKNFVLGIEKEDLYKENIKLLGSILSLQPEIDAICAQMEKDVSKIKRDYSSKQARKLEKLIKSFKNKDIDAKHYYSELKLIADGFNLSIDKYPNIKIYLSLLDNSKYVNNKKVIHEFTKFVSEMKNVVSYQQYTQLLKKSNNFSNLDDIFNDLIVLDKQYAITQNLKLENFKNFLTYLEFNQNINPIKLVQEEESFINELYIKAGRTKYEKEVSFLSDFIRTIKQYFTADISADEYYKFEKNYALFKTVWPSYFSENIIKNLDQYQKLLSKYHKNNILRDNIFADCLISKKNDNNKIFVNDTDAAIKQIKSNLNNKKIKLVVTGGFHTRGLERIFEKQKISYVIITPKITQPIEQAKQIYIDNVMYYSNILKNTINLEPLTQEPLNVSFPKIMNLIFSEIQKNVIFEEYSKEELIQAVKQFIQEYIIVKQSSFYGDVEILNWDIISTDLTGSVEFYVEYKDNANKSTISNIKYRFVDGQIVSYSSIDNARTKQMLERIKTNTYAQPSIELEPTNTTRKKIAKHILEPLRKIIGNAVTLMPLEQLHMTIGYDSTPMTQQEIDSLVQEGNISAEIFSVLDTLGQDFVNFRTSMAGTLKLMPDGVIIYEITDKDLIGKMVGFRTILKSVDSKYSSPSIVHMSIGRITDEKLLDGSEQSKQELAELLQKLNEKIYEINKKNALSKIKTTFTLKSGYVSSTGDKDFIFRRILPKKESLVVFKNLIDSSKTKLNFVHKVIIAPIIEELAFRFIPFFVAGLFVSNPVSIVPIIVTGIVGILGFSFAHPLADKINNYFYNEKETGKIKNDFISKLFSEQVNVRNLRDFLLPSTILTAVFVTASFVFPQSIFVAVIITSLLHSLNNAVSAKRENALLLNIKQTPSSQDKSLEKEINQIIEMLEIIARNKTLGYRQERSDFIDDFENIGEDKEAITQKVIELFEFVVQNQKKQNCFDLIYLLEPILDISAHLRDEQGNVLFDKFFKFIFKQASDNNNASTKYFEILIDSAKYFYKTGQIGYVHKIIDSLYKNKPFVKSLMDYKKVALPLPSPFSFDSVKEWEDEIYKIMTEDNGLNANWYFPMLEIFISSLSTEHKLDEYAKAYIRALYKSGKQKETPRIRDLDEYEWNKAFYEACGIEQENDESDIPKSEPLLDEENIKLFADNAEILKTNNLYLSDIISRLKYLRQFIPSEETLNSTQYLQIIEKLTTALSLPKQAQMEVITAQMNELVDLFIEKKCFLENEKILEILTPVLIFVKSNKTEHSLINLIPVKVHYWGEIINEEALCNVVSFVYDINKQEAMSLINKIYGEPQKRDIFGINWEYWRPKNLQEAYDKVPKYLKKTIKTYEDLELFYYTLGIEFDSIENNSLLYDRREYVPEYQLLLNKLPVSAFEQREQSKKYFRTLKKEILSTQDQSEDTEKLSMYFEALEKVLDNNLLALSEINKVNKDAMDDAFLFVEEMINGFELLNETAAKKARSSLETIKKNFSDSKVTVSELVKLRGWTVKEMDNITELHTLINAVHQTAINSLLTKLKYSKLGSKCVFKENYEEQFSFFDCSKTKISKQMEDFIAYLKLGFFLSKGIKVVVKDNKLVYSKSLGAHSVDVMVDLNEGIRVTFNDSGRGDGNAMRVLLLSSLFAQAGFDITNLDAKTDIIEGICSFTAMCSLPKGALNNGIEYAKYFEQALNILGDTKDLDFQLEGRDEDGDSHSYGEYIIPSYNLERINKLKNSTNMPDEFTFATMPEERFKEKQKNNPARNKILSPVLGRQWHIMSQMLINLKKRMEQSSHELDSVYDQLLIKEKSKRNVWGIVSEYVKGKLIINKDGILERNKDYDGIDVLLDAIETDVDDSSRQSQVINLLDFDDLNFETEGYIGGMVALSGTLRLDGKGWLSIKVAVDKERKRAKFAYVEFVDFEGNRRRLNYKELIEILKEFGYAVKEQKPRSHSEKKESLTILKERILFPKDGIYTRGMSVSGQADKYVPVKITYDKNNVDENSMWVVSYTTPEDVATIISAGAIMTTTGGMLSHANITARENKKTAILSNGKWVEGKLEVPYYSIESSIEQRRDYEIQKISEHSLVLEEGDVVLANGINGRVLVYNDIPGQEISEIQKAIDDNNMDFIMNYIQDHYQDKNIRQIIEYIFLQVITDKEKQKITQFLLAWDKNSEIGIKVSELLKVYTGEKIKALKIYIENERKIKDANIRLAIIKFIEQELDVLQYSLTDDDIVNEVQQLMDIVNRDRNFANSQRLKEVRTMIRQANEILTKSDIFEQDKDDLIKISERAKVWNFYGSSEIKDLVNEIDKIISLEAGKNYETEIRDFEDIRAKDIVRYGTKTTELAKLFRSFKDFGIKIATVPHGVGISKDVLRIFFEQNGLGEKYSKLIEEFQQAVKSKDKEKAIDVGKEISKLIESTNDKQLESYLKSKLDDDKKYAVRSSGVGEDGANHAFAGMAKTELNVNKDNVYSKVKEGWKSFFTDTCIEDMIKNGIVVQPALLVQEMVSGVEKAGVMFTRDNSGNLTTECVLGLGEGLVSGRITPDHITVRASDGRIEYRRALNNMIKIEEKEQGGTRVAKITDEEKIERILDEETIKQLQEIANILEEDAGYPVDIEFAIDKNGKIFVLQRRAITTLATQEEIEPTSQKVSVPVIDQSFIDEVIEMISTLSMFDEIKGIVDKLSNLPEDVNEKYNVIMEQVNDLVKFLKEQHKKNHNIQISLQDRYGRYYGEDSIYGKLRNFCLEKNLIRSFDSNVYLSNVVVYVLTSFLTLVDIKNSGNLLFYSIIDSLFTDKYGADRDDKTVLSEMANIINFTYSINPNFVPYIVNKLVEKNFISVDKNAPYEIRSGLKDNYDAQKYYYFALSTKDKVNDNMSKNLLENVVKLRDTISLIENEDIRQDMNKILFNLDDLIDKINNKNIVLLEMQLNSLLEKAKILKDTNKEVAFKIVDIILSICDQGVKENKDLNAVNLKIYDLLYPLLIEEFDNNTDHTLFNNVISKLNLLIQQKNNDNNVGEFKTFNAEVVKMLLNVALHIYEPISSHELDDKNSREYKNREQLCLDIFRNLSVKRVTDTYIYSCLFNRNDNGKQGLGFTPETLDILINAAKQNNYILAIPSTTDDLIDENVELLANMVVDSIEYINPIHIFTYSFYKELNDDDWFSSRTENKEKMKRFSCLVMEKLLSVAKDNNVNLAKRKRAVNILLETISSGVYKNNIKDVPIRFEEVKLLAEKLNVPVFIYLGDASIRNSSGHFEYSFTPLIKFIPKSILEKFSLPLLDKNLKKGEEASDVLLKNKKPIITKISGKTNTSVAEVQQVLIRFLILQKIMEYNKSVLLLLDKLNDSKNYNKNVAELLNELQTMINELKKINIEHGNAAQEALDNIITDLNDNTIDRRTKVRRHLLLSAWTKWEIKDIKEIHTLINAVHQISIADFKREIGDISKIGAPIQLITAHQESTIEGYNLSDTINSNIIKFLSKLATRKVPNSSINDFICKDDLVVWTTKLNQHSVDIFFNFGEADRGISIYYKEIPDNSYERGKKERVRYFKEILEYLGFYVEIDTEKYNNLDSYNIKATLNKDYGMNETMDLIDIATQVVEIFKYSSNIDCDFETRHYESQFEDVYKRWVTKAKRRETWYGVEISNRGKFYGYGQNGYKLDLLPEKRSLNAESLNDILFYLGCDLLPKEVTREDLFDPIYLNKYFNKPIERAYAEGRIIFNEEGVLVRNEGYDIVYSMVNELNTNFTETSKQARIFNLVNTYEFDTRMLAYIGSFVVVSSVMELKNGDKLFIKAIMDPNTKRMKYAIAEKVANLTRQKLSSDELIEILDKEGYIIPEQEWVMTRERKRIKNMLSRQIQTIESPKIPSTPTSDGTGVSVVGNITFDKNNVDANSILVVPYTTPDDMRFIETAKGIITTGGGVLSHAAITTRELKKPSVVLNGATWTNNEIEIVYYLASDEPETINSQYQVQKVKATRKILKEGSRVLVNGETGAVLLFDDINISLLDELQSYIDADDAKAVIDFMNKYSKDENINRLVEYVYFQAIGNSKTTQILDCLFSDDMPEIVQNKVKELNDSYIQDKVQSISEAIENLKTIDNVNIAYMVLQELNKKLAFIKTVGIRPEIEELKEQLTDLEQDIKTKLSSYMQDFINDFVALLGKEKLNSSDIQKIITMLKNVEIYNYFVSENEISTDLFNKKETLQILVPMMRDKINGYTEQKETINLQEEISLFEENAENEKLFGSKTSQLAKIYKLLQRIKGVIVPGGIGISVNVMPMLFKTLGKENLLMEFENAIKNKNKQKAMEIAEEICDVIDSEGLKGTELEKEIIKYLNKFIKPGQKYSVRSSGVGEDATNNAFAGMGETKLNVGYDDIYDNVRECWKSFFSERCIDYMISSGQIVKPAVLVEEMVESKISGVVFSRDKYGNGRINALFGQGEGLVSGMLDPDNVLFDMSTGEIIEYLVANKYFKLVTDVNGGIKKNAVGQQAKSRALSAKNVKKLAEIISVLENSAGYPIDVEFAIKDDEIYILQMRPITTLDNKEKDTETTGAENRKDLNMQEIPFTETRYEISLTVGDIPKGQEAFAYIANPLDPTQSIPVYKKSADAQVTEFIVDTKYASLVKDGSLGRALMLRINTDPVMLAKLNDGIFNYKPGEIGLLPILDEDVIEKSLFDSSTESGIENIKKLLASA